MTELVLLAVLLLVTALVAVFLVTLWSGLPSVPTESKTVAEMVRVVRGRPGRAVDLGSGDGRLVIALAERGIPTVGYEINPLLVWWSRRRIRRAGLPASTEIRFGSFWKANLSGYDLVVLYGIAKLMPRLERKLQQELKPGAQVVSNAFTFPGWHPAASRHGVHRYTIGHRTSVE